MNAYDTQTILRVMAILTCGASILIAVVGVDWSVLRYYPELFPSLAWSVVFPFSVGIFEWVIAESIRYNS